MSYELIAFVMCLPVALMAFSFGQWTKESPSEEEMMRRIVEDRVHARIRREVEAELATEINRRAAQS